MNCVFRDSINLHSMSATKYNTTRNITRYLILIVSTLLLLIASCPIKKGIISLAHIQTEADDFSPKKLDHFAAYLMQTCEVSESVDGHLFQAKTVLVTDYLPVLLFTVTAFLFISFGHPIQKLFPSCGNSNIPIYLSLFLQHRRLII